jgi:hypothetical protein
VRFVSYFNMDHADWMQRHIDSGHEMKRKMHPSTPQRLNEFQCKVVDIIGIVGGGIYNAPISLDKIDWAYGGTGIRLAWKGDQLATWDFNQLSLLVFLCHEARIRCSVEACGPRTLRLAFWQRKESGDMAVRHPDLAEAIASFQQALPQDSRIRFAKVAS